MNLKNEKGISIFIPPIDGSEYRYPLLNLNYVGDNQNRKRVVLHVLVMQE
jgi:hypothetical protein